MRQLIAKVWRALPIPLRQRVIRLTQRTFTVGVSAVVLNDRNEILLLRHRFREGSGWELPGGFIKKDEDLEGTARRELAEETGLDVQVLTIVAARLNKPHQLDICFLARVIGGILHIDRTEIHDARFFAGADLPSTLEPDQMRNISLALQRTDDFSR